MMKKLPCTPECRKLCPPSPTPLFANYFEAKVERGHLLEYQINLVHTYTYAPTVPHDGTLKHDSYSDLLEQLAALINMYHRKSLA